MIIGTIYFVFILLVGANCYGMHCIGLFLFGGPLFIALFPWVFILNLLPTIFAKSEPNGLLEYPFLEPSTWPGLIVLYLGLTINMWLLGKAIEWFVERRKKNKNRYEM